MARIVYTGGTFDLFHPGHVNLLRQCRKIAGEDGSVCVALNTDEFVEAYKGKRPVMSYQERSAVLRASRYVDYVVENLGGTDSLPTISSVRPDFIVVGSDWATKDYYKQMGFSQKWLDVMGITLVYVPYTEAISSTKIKARMK